MNKGIWSRLTAAPLSVRYYQLTNGFVNAVIGEQMGITHLAEYPRCGGSWIRHLMQDAMEIPQYAYDRPLTKNSIIQCHVLPNWMIRRAVVIFRDPRDAIVSFYHKKVSYDKNFRGGRAFHVGNYHHDPERDIKEDFCEFLKVHLTAPDHPRFSFSEFATAWLAEDNTCIAKYEDFKTEPTIQLRRLTEFVGVDVADSKIEEAVEQNSFANRTKRRSGKVRTVGETDNSQFERKGIVGDWKNLFNDEARKVFLKHEGETLTKLEYEPNDEWASS
jgi:hypothetical protein